ncbi:hypothetical protein [Lacipirellula sp.]|uniref:hypothetical protein n=1 Tax=Lacipirellula sp. TaxID=2691419 RepID=UPI003D13ECE1
MGLFGRRKISIKDVSVQLSGWELVERNASIEAYQHENGDLFTINFFDLPPDIGASLADVDGVRDFYRQMLVSNHLAMLECEIESLDGLPTVYVLAKAPLQPTGFAFIASQIIPRQDCSVVLKYQAVEEGVTGMRESIVMSQLMQPEQGSFADQLSSWCADPYDPSLKYPVMRNRADSPEFDEKFPDHPLSRARAFMNQLPARVTIFKSLRKAPEFKR